MTEYTAKEVFAEANRHGDHVADMLTAYAERIEADERVAEGWVPITALRDLYRAYVRTLEAGRDRITSLGGSCDSVEDMELCDPALSVARRAMLAAAQQADRAEPCNRNCDCVGPCKMGADR